VISLRGAEEPELNDSGCMKCLAKFFFLFLLFVGISVPLTHISTAVPPKAGLKRTNWKSCLASQSVALAMTMAVAN